MKLKALPVFFLLIIVHSLSTQVWAAKDDKPVLEGARNLVAVTRQGSVKGLFEQGVYVWKGIPYAKAPLGELRFSSPQPHEPWSGVKETTVYGAASPQPDNSFVGDGPRNEDCLFMNIWTPAPDSKKRPVMVWIHGGGFVVGSGSSELYNGANLARNGDVVVVTFNYRLGALGFLYFENKPGFDNNLGIRDQIAALRWVRENIASFGGDPDQITIFGESAGGTSVETLLACNEANGLFKGAIAQSGPAAIIWQPTVASALTKKYFAFLGISPDSLQLLKTLPIDTLKYAEERLMKYMIEETPNKVFSPTIDGKLLKADIFTCLNPLKSPDVALMIGTNKDESTMFASKRLKMAPSTAEGLDRELFPVFKPEDKSKVIAAYKDYPKKRAVLNLLTDAVFRIPAIRLAENQSQHAAVYMYRFEWSSFLLNVAGLRSFHGLEIPFVFGNKEGRSGKLLKLLATNRMIKSLSGEMQTAWINFARYGNPNGKDAEYWKRFDANERATMIFNRKSMLVTDPDQVQRKAWEGVSYY